MRHEPGYIIIDTEGTGLFRHSNIDPATGDKKTAGSDEPGQPRMAAFAAVLTDADLQVQHTYTTFIKPEGWMNAEKMPDGLWRDTTPMTEMPPEAFAIHGLSMEFLHEHGVPAGLALGIYIKSILDGRAVLGFNQQHDGRQVRAELRRAGIDDMFKRTPTTCAMLSLRAAKIKIKKLNGKGGMAGLVDACAHFGIDHPADVRHKPLEDALACREVALRLHELGLLLPPDVHYAKNYQGEKESVS